MENQNEKKKDTLEASDDGKLEDSPSGKVTGQEETTNEAVNPLLEPGSPNQVNRFQDPLAETEVIDKTSVDKMPVESEKKSEKKSEKDQDEA